jgi:multiple sugar transport system ATP-binding protein
MSNTMSLSAVSIRSLHKRFGTVDVLRGVDLEVRAGEFLTLVGPSGCGKSTLLRMIAGLDQPTGGSISIAGECVDGRHPKRRNVAMVFQNYALYPHMTVGQNMAVPLRMRKLSQWQRLPLVGRWIGGARAVEREVMSDVRTTAALLSIEALLDRKPAQLSGGQRQRTALGRAMVRKPNVFLMDEPLSNLDAKLRTQMRSELVQLHRRLRTAFVYVTHDQGEAMTMSDRIAVMLDGEILQIDEPSTVYDEPQHRKVAEFLVSPKVNLLPGSIRSDGGIEVLGIALQGARFVASGAPITVGFHPENCELAATGSAAAIAGRYLHRERIGTETFVHVQSEAAGETLVVRASASDAARLEVDQQVGVRLAANRALVFDGAGRRLRPASADAALI